MDWNFLDNFVLLQVFIKVKKVKRLRLPEIFIFVMALVERKYYGVVDIILEKLMVRGVKQELRQISMIQMIFALETFDIVMISSQMSLHMCNC